MSIRAATGTSESAYGELKRKLDFAVSLVDCDEHSCPLFDFDFWIEFLILMFGFGL